MAWTRAHFCFDQHPNGDRAHGQVTNLTQIEIKQIISVQTLRTGIGQDMIGNVLANTHCERCKRQRNIETQVERVMASFHFPCKQFLFSNRQKKSSWKNQCKFVRDDCIQTNRPASHSVTDERYCGTSSLSCLIISTMSMSLYCFLGRGAQ